MLYLREIDIFYRSPTVQRRDDFVCDKKMTGLRSVAANDYNQSGKNHGDSASFPEARSCACLNKFDRPTFTKFSQHFESNSCLTLLSSKPHNGSPASAGNSSFAPPRDSGFPIRQRISNGASATERIDD